MKYLIQAILFLFCANSFSQGEIECMTTIPQSHITSYREHQKSMENLLVDFDVNDGFNLMSLKVKIHVIRRSDGTGGITASEIQTSVEQAIEIFEEVNITYEYCDINYIDNDDFFEEVNFSLSSSSEEYQMAIPNNEADAINVYYMPNPISGGSRVCGWSSFPSFEEDFGGKNWIVMDNECATNGSTLAHEFGHYFNLLHTHQSGNEKVDREGSCSNCETAGDELCDTPADPTLGLNNVLPSCSYFSDDRDDCGRLFSPDTRNIMSFTRRSCRDNFSDGQINRMLLSLAVDRTNLSTTCNGCQLEIRISNDVVSGDIDVQRASNTIEAHNEIEVDASADYRAGEIVRFSIGFRANKGSNLRAINESCSSNSSSITDQIEVLEEESDLFNITDNFSNNGFSIYPNPIQDIARVNYNFEFNREYSVELYTFNGLPLLTEQLDISNPQINLSQLNTGLYIIKLFDNSGSELISEKISIN